MRPVEKKKVGEKINLFEDISDMTTQEHIIQEEYKHYQYARKVLLANLGRYCSYCEACLSNGAILQTEHVQPKGLEENGHLKYDHLQYRWTNFLLGCATCNGAGNKGTKDVDFSNIHLPHLNNTYLSLEYKEAGVVNVNPALTGESRVHADNLVKLVGLDKPDSETDMRCDMRRHAWDKAQIFLEGYKNGTFSLDLLIALIREENCWSIWYTVFKGCDEVRAAMLEIPGTAKNCFDSANQYEPIERNPGKADPV